MVMTERGTLSPLTPVVRSGSIAVTIFGLTSFLSALALLIYLTYKLVRWHLGIGSGRSRRKRKPGYVFTSGPVKFGPAHDVAKLAGADPTVDAASLAPSERLIQGPRYPNQFIVLILNLLIADLHQSTAFALSLTWLLGDSLDVGSPACFTQGLFVSVGDLSSSCFMAAVAIHTFYSIVFKYRPSHKALYFYIISIWAFVYLISLLPVAGTRNGASMGGFFVRAGVWQRRGDLVNAKNTGYHHPAFLIYPVIYLICILPLAIGRVASMAKKEPPLPYFGFAGALAASNGWLDVLLFTTTRRSIVFGDDFGNEDTGIDTFTFMNSTPSTFGNTIWVRGGREEQKHPSGGWWRILGDPESTARKPSRLGKSLSQTSLTPMERNAIQMEIITTVVVEDDRSRSIDRKGPSESTSSQNNE
ncbi:hypothetical protein FHL15_003942 [Xylaria flabelliformis]|uniref:Uncharacterized protein n=1 Tax=Xylaria flabelliformis TaxID=2512241 RepID=A0A553I4W6_9PEZI|nr:hypothetical protein FHL15_003942 [Xylaria flabelliformis]